MDVRLYPSAPAVGARPGAETAGLAHLDYYHCGKVGGKVGRGRASRARAWGRSHLAAADAATLGLTRGTRTQQPRRWARAAHTATLAVTHTPRVVDHRQKSARQPPARRHGDTLTHTSYSFTSRRAATLCHPTRRHHTQPSPSHISHRASHLSSTTLSLSPTYTATLTYTSHFTHPHTQRCCPRSYPLSHPVTTGDSHTKK